MEKAVQDFNSWSKQKIEEDSLIGSAADAYAKKKGIDVKKYPKRKSSELSNGGPIRSELIDLVADLEKATGIQLKATGGNDEYHQNIKSYKSNHTKGLAIDVVSNSLRDSKENRKKFEDAIIDIMISGKYDIGGMRLGAINEYDRPTSKSTGGHFHLSITPDEKSRDSKECYLFLNKISSYSQIRNMKQQGGHITRDNKVTTKIPDTMQIGAKGDDVRDIQVALLGMGYPLPKFGTDGKYGEETKAAVMAYQRDKGLKMTGELDKHTVANLKAAKKSGAKPVAKAKARRYYKIFDRDNRRTVIAKYKNGVFNVFDKYKHKIGDVTNVNGVITMTTPEGSNDITDSHIGKTLKGIFDSIS